MEQPEQEGERVVIGVRRCRQEEHTRIESLERALDVIRLRHSHDRLEPECVRLVPHREIGADHDRIRGHPARLEHAAEMEGELRGRADRARARSRGEPVGALPFGRCRARRVRHLDEDRDPVASAIA